jgi:Flp pilus assembly protein TadG
MFRPSSSPPARRSRAGKTLVMFVMLTPVLAGAVGLVIDSGLMMAYQRQTQNAADAAALAAAQQKMIGASDDTAVSEANNFLTTNGVTGVTLVKNQGTSTTTTTGALNLPPQTPSSPYYNTSNYVEAIVTRKVNTLLIQLLSGTSTQQVTARAVAGYEPVGAGQGVMVLDSTVAPGLSVAVNSSSNNTPSLTVNGNITVNSPGGAGKNDPQIDQYGVSVAGTISNSNSPAISTSNSTATVAPIVATDIQVVGGIDNINNVGVYDSAYTNNYNPNNPDRPIFARAPTAPDPLSNVGTPTMSSYNFYDGSGNIATTPQAISVSTGGSVTLNPGIYQSISITGAGTLTFNPGVYVIGINLGGGNPKALDLSGGTVTGNGVLIYNTGGTYTAGTGWGKNGQGKPGWNPTNGGDDASDGNNSVGNTNNVNFGSINVSGNNGSSINLNTTSAYSNSGNSSDPMNGLTVYQRRWNTTALGVQGNASNVNVGGTWYAKWANFTLGGNGSYNAQFLVGSMTINGGAAVTINATGKNKGKANLVFLVE